MSAHPNHLEAGLDEQEALHYRAIVRRLADIAMQMAEAILQDSQTPLEPGAPRPDHTVRFERISRTVRRTVLLARRLAEPLPQPRPPASPPPFTDRTSARKRILRKVEDAISRGSRYDDLDAQSLEAELLDRLDRPDLEHDLASRPIDEIIADIARDLGVGFRMKDDFIIGKRRTPEDVDQLAARAVALPIQGGGQAASTTRRMAEIRDG